MTVEELIEVLRTLPPHAEVWADGCDCSNPVTGAEVDWQNEVTIRVQN